MSAQTKRNSLFQEAIGRYRNMSDGISTEEKNKMLGKFMNTLRVSGYNRKYRYTLLHGIVQGQRQCEDLVRQGLRIRYKSREQIKAQNQQRLGKYPNTWFLRGTYTNILKTQYTPCGLLKDTLDRKINSTVNAYGGQTKIVKLAGKPLLAGMRRPANFGGN